MAARRKPANQRREYGSGRTVYESPKGSGRYRGSIKLDDGRTVWRSGRSVAEVEDALDEIEQAHDDGLPIGDRNMTVRAFLEHWLEHAVPARARVESPNTVSNYKWAVETYLVPELGSIKLRALTPDHVDEMLRRLAKKGRSKATRKKGLSKSSLVRVRAALVTALEYAEKRGYVSRNVARLSDIPAKVRPPKEGRSLTPTEATALLEAARGDRLEALYVTQLLLGLRPGEVTGLAWSDVDLEAGTLQVRRALKREGRTLRLGAVKTKTSARGLDLPAPVVEALKAHAERQEVEMMAAGSRWHGPTFEGEEVALVFSTETGGLIDPSNLRRAFSKVTTAAGLGHWHPHELRHSTASLLSAAGVPLEQIADVLGHSSTRVTEQVYRHHVAPTVGAHVEAMEALARKS